MESRLKVIYERNKIYWMTMVDGGYSPADAINDYYSSVIEDIDSRTRVDFAYTLLSAFVQDNFTGPPTEKTFFDIFSVPSDFLDPSSDRVSRFLGDLDRTCARIIEEETGEDIVPLLKLLPCLIISQYIMERISEDDDDGVHLALAKIWFIKQRLCDFPSETIDRKLSEHVEKYEKRVENKSAEDKCKFYILKGLSRILYHKDASECFTKACKEIGFEWRLTGRLGKRTKFQKFDVAQLTVEMLNSSLSQTGENVEGRNLKTVPLEDDTLLETIRYLNEQVVECKQSPMTQCILLANLQNVIARNPKDELTCEQMNAFLEKVVESPLNFSIHTQALYWRSKLDSTRKRKVERSIMQIQALVDQFPLTNESEGGAVFETRIKYFWCLMYPLFSNLQTELARIFMDYGMIRSAKEIYERLERWEEVIHCLVAMDEREKAEALIFSQLERCDSPKPKLLCMLGDIRNEPEKYEKAWEVSNGRYARAMRSLGAYYYKQEEFQKSIECYDKALKVNSLFENAWFTVGCAAMQLEQWEKAHQAFIKCIQLEDANAEAWNNLAAINLKMGKKADAFRCFQMGLKEKFDSWKMWENYLYLAVDLKHFDDAIQSIDRLLELSWKERSQVDCNVVDVVVKGVIEAEVVSNSVNARLQQILTKITRMHTNLVKLWISKAKFDRFLNDFPSELHSLQSANRSCQMPGAHIYEEEDFKKVSNIALMLADAYERGQATGKLSDGRYQARLILRRLMKQGKQNFEDHPTYAELQQRYKHLDSEI